MTRPAGSSRSRLALETYARRARRRTPDEDLAELTGAHARPELATVPWRPTLQELAERCTREAQAWWAGGHELAKELRVGQRELIEGELTGPVPGWAATIDHGATPMVYRSVARLVVLHLTFESGRDIERAVYGTDLLSWDGP